MDKCNAEEKTREGQLSVYVAAACGVTAHLSLHCTLDIVTACPWHLVVCAVGSQSVH